MTKVLLALYNPPQAGMDVLELARLAEVYYFLPVSPVTNSTVSKAEIRDHTIQLCGMIKCLGNKHAGALVNSVGPLVLCKSQLLTSISLSNK